MSQIADWVAGMPSRPGRNNGVSGELGVPLTAMPTQIAGLNLGLPVAAAP
jgi:hypothetical protein